MIAALAPLILAGIEGALNLIGNDTVRTLGRNSVVALRELLEGNRELAQLQTRMAQEGRTELTADERAIVDRVTAKARALEAKLKGPQT